MASLVPSLSRSPLSFLCTYASWFLLVEEGFVASHLDRYCEERGFLGWFETSAKENINIEEAANLLVDEVFILNDVRNFNLASMVSSKCY